MTTHIELGAVFRLPWGADLVRVLAFDQRVVMYDVWWSHKNAWRLAKPPSNVTYYRLPRDLFEEMAKFERFDPYSPEEFALHQPQLPFSFAQSASLSWYGFPPSVDRINIALQDRPSLEHKVTLLEVASVYLQPFGPKGGVVSAIQVSSSTHTGFTEAELLSEAWKIQSQHCGAEILTRGVGLHRSGLRKGVPSYYVWGANSKLDDKSPNRI